MLGSAIWMRTCSQSIWRWRTGGTCLTRDRDLFTVLKPDRTLFAVGVIEDDGNACFGDTGLTALIYEILLVLGTHLEGDVRRWIDPLNGIHPPETCLLSQGQNIWRPRCLICLSR
jgi:hypothetical protein